MIGTEVQSIEVIPFAFHFGAGGDLPAHGDEEVLDVFHQLGERVTRTQRLAVDGQRHVHGLGRERRGFRGGLQFLFARAECATEVGAELAHQLPGFLLLILGQRSDGLAGFGHSRLGAGILRFDGFQFLQTGGVLDFGDAFSDRIAYRLGVKHHTLCHGFPF